MPTYNKLVRDKIPKIIENAGKEALTRILDEMEYEKHLIEKLGEEVEEFVQTPNEEELADIMEVVEAIMKMKKISWETVRAVQAKKRQERGGFEDRVFLEEVME
ncbi:Predicted house-cleaning noncanonical NTP pyrophosphatase, all-alpha NTP-PPase (MazG) superfamily [Peptoclostridium litorale DSM 5388]|uniref:Phosphoribosyl-ATP pyrophosphohydrolase n=1 Tax=Peptoclostridium litorale DSM 5388 TaxID=1121324 RepID=A0A069RCQ5_PEPLI|nr:nucleoside triphosphate pyrophosphohydrolase [Peptoclostridium litorale]KDR94543.1 hypothetical protein CLIT_14c00040 [Peptoclostridium litorale DSM 5388]SIO31198.1 Predicted house-cleaning noncanonical NTP pyrophosphatase, all-alpha NTP-PPase (MazG) superfamily [Peptoclostridium litorale DSM 5388]